MSAPATPVARWASLCALLLASVPATDALAAQERAAARDGPLIRGFGAVWDIPSPDMATDPDHVYRVVFDVSGSADEPGEVNPYLDTVARFLNMHARAGVSPENLHVAVVLHGEAAKDALEEGAFEARWGRPNRNADLVRRLADAGVELYICGQSMMSRSLPRDGLADPVRVALSAMTAMELLQGRGYRTVN